jgi:hypothetical protein
MYRYLPTTHKGITFKKLICKLINFIDGRRMRRYMVLKINQALDLHDNYEDVEAETDAHAEEVDADNDLIHDKMCAIYDEFSEEGQCWIDRFCSIVDEATEEQRFTMLNLLRILNLGPEPDEALLIAKDRNADAINNINNNI